MALDVAQHPCAALGIGPSGMLVVTSSTSSKPKAAPRAGHAHNTLGFRPRRAPSCAKLALTGVQTPAAMPSIPILSPFPQGSSSRQGDLGSHKDHPQPEAGALRGAGEQSTAGSKQRLQTLSGTCGRRCRSSRPAAFPTQAGVFAHSTGCQLHPHLCQQHVAVPGHLHNTPTDPHSSPS